jgi:hypothetical protein
LGILFADQKSEMQQRAKECLMGKEAPAPGYIGEASAPTPRLGVGRWTHSHGLNPTKFSILFIFIFIFCFLKNRFLHGKAYPFLDQYNARANVPTLF